jgi:hypothetical protein
VLGGGAKSMDEYSVLFGTLFFLLIGAQRRFSYILLFARLEASEIKA